MSQPAVRAAFAAAMNSEITEDDARAFVRSVKEMVKEGPYIDMTCSTCGARGKVKGTAPDFKGIADVLRMLDTISFGKPAETVKVAQTTDAVIRDYREMSAAQLAELASGSLA